MKLPSKLDLAIWGVAALGVVFMFLVVKRWHDLATIDLPAARAAISRLEKEAEQKAKQQEISDDVGSKRTEVAAAIADPRRSLPPVWVCKQPASVPAVSQAPVGAEPAASSGEPEVPGGDSPRDVSDGATVYGKRCELLRAELILVREWVRRQHELSRQTGSP